MVQSKGRKVYQAVINIVLMLMTLCMVLPLILLFMSSITEENTLVANGYSFFPAKFSLEAYLYIMQNANTVFRAYGITILVTVIGTVAGFHDSVSVVLKRFAGTEGDKFLRFFHHAFFGWAGALIHYVDNHVPYKKYLVGIYPAKLPVGGV